MDNLPNDPSNPNNGNNNNSLPPFGSGFTPHANPVDTNNPYQSQPPQNPVPQPPQPPVSTPTSPSPPIIPENPDDLKHERYSEVAQQKPRDEHGRFIKDDDPSPSPNPSVPSGSSNPSSNSFLPPLVETNPKEYNPDPDPPIVTVRNPITYIKKWWNKILAKEGIDFKLGFRIKPITAVLIASVIISGGVSSGVTAIVLKTFFPTSSPILHRQIVQQGSIQKSATGGFYLTDTNQTMWKLKSKNPSLNFNDQVGKLVTVTGNMTKENNVIEVSEIILSQ